MNFTFVNLVYVPLGILALGISYSYTLTFLSPFFGVVNLDLSFAGIVVSLVQINVF